MLELGRGTQLDAPNCSVANAFYLAKPPRVASNCGVILLHLQPSFHLHATDAAWMVAGAAAVALGFWLARRAR